VKQPRASVTWRSYAGEGVMIGDRDRDRDRDKKMREVEGRWKGEWSKRVYIVVQAARRRPYPKRDAEPHAVIHRSQTYMIHLLPEDLAV
jgi:hypothetical protein